MQSTYDAGAKMLAALAAFVASVGASPPVSTPTAKQIGESILRAPRTPRALRAGRRHYRVARRDVPGARSLNRAGLGQQIEIQPPLTSSATRAKSQRRLESRAGRAPKASSGHQTLNLHAMAHHAVGANPVSFRYVLRCGVPSGECGSTVDLFRF